MEKNTPKTLFYKTLFENYTRIPNFIGIFPKLHQNLKNLIRNDITKQFDFTPLIKDSVGILNKVDLNGLNKFIGSFGNLIGSVSTPEPVSSSTKV